MDSRHTRYILFALGAALGSVGVARRERTPEAADAVEPAGPVLRVHERRGAVAVHARDFGRDVAGRGGLNFPRAEEEEGFGAERVVGRTVSPLTAGRRAEDSAPYLAGGELGEGLRVRRVAEAEVGVQGAQEQRLLVGPTCGSASGERRPAQRF